MRWVSDTKHWHWYDWRFALWPTSRWMGDYREWIWLEPYQRDCLGKIRFREEQM